MEMLESQWISCPYCGESIEVMVDVSAGDQSYIEDCQVCCRPIEMQLRVVGADWQLEATRDDQ